MYKKHRAGLFLETVCPATSHCPRACRVFMCSVISLTHFRLYLFFFFFSVFMSLLADSTIFLSSLLSGPVFHHSSLHFSPVCDEYDTHLAPPPLSCAVSHGIDPDPCLHEGDVTHTSNTPPIAPDSLASTYLKKNQSDHSSRRHASPLTSCLIRAKFWESLFDKCTSVSSLGKCQGHSLHGGWCLLWLSAICVMDTRMEAKSVDDRDTARSTHTSHQ